MVTNPTATDTNSHVMTAWGGKSTDEELSDIFEVTPGESSGFLFTVFSMSFLKKTHTQLTIPSNVLNQHSNTGKFTSSLAMNFR